MKENYSVMDFSHYYKGDRFTQAAEFVNFCKPILPKYIDTILEFGCCNGKNLQIFNGKYNLCGYDIVDESDIDFVENFDNFIYEKKSIENWVDIYDKDLSKTFVMCSGTLMYISSECQNEFIRKLFSLNCKNMAFQEYWPTMHPDGKQGGFGFNKKNMDLFEIYSGWQNNGSINKNLSVLVGIDGYNWEFQK